MAKQKKEAPEEPLEKKLWKAADRWQKDAHSTVYVVEAQTTPGPLAPWERVGTTSKVSFTIEGLTPGQLYVFRVRGTNGNSNGNPSDPAEQRSL